MTQIQRGFKAVMSRGDDIKLDPDEVQLVLQGSKRGLMVQVKQGLINPSFLVSIIEDKQREVRMSSGFRHEQRNLGMEPLKDLLASAMPVGITIGSGDGRN